MPLLIDVYNVLHVVGVLPPDLAGPDLAGLARLIAASRWSREPVLLVCDGVRPPEVDAAEPLPAGMRTRYAGRGRTADDVIRAEIARSSAPRRLLVVSSDNEIERAARRRRCETMRSEAFLARLVQDHDRSGRAAVLPPVGPAEIPEDLRREAIALEEAWAFGPDETDGDDRVPTEPMAASGAPADSTQPAPSATDPDEAAAPDAPPPLPILLPAELLAEAERLVRSTPPPPAPATPTAPAPPAVPLEPPPPTIPIANGVAAMVREAIDLARQLDAPSRRRAGDDRAGADADATDASRTHDAPGGPAPDRDDGPWIPDRIRREAERLLEDSSAPPRANEPRRDDPDPVD